MTKAFMNSVGPIPDICTSCQEQENYEEEYEQYHGFDMTMM